MIAGSGRLVQSGSGTLILTTNNTYSGVTLVNAGTLQVGNSGAIGSLGTGNVTNNADLAFNRSDAVELYAKEFLPPRWSIHEILCEGLSVLAGRPKLGKSWLALCFALAIASGGLALGKKPVEQGDALFLGLEDGARRLQGRLRLLLGAGPISDRPDVLRYLRQVLPDSKRRSRSA